MPTPMKPILWTRHAQGYGRKQRSQIFDDFRKLFEGFRPILTSTQILAKRIYWYVVHCITGKPYMHDQVSRRFPSRISPFWGGNYLPSSPTRPQQNQIKISSNKFILWVSAAGRFQADLIYPNIHITWGNVHRENKQPGNPLPAKWPRPLQSTQDWPFIWAEHETYEKLEVGNTTVRLDWKSCGSSSCKKYFHHH